MRRRFLSDLVIRNPANGELLAQLPIDGAKSVSKKFDDAQMGFKELNLMSLNDRKNAISRFSQLLEQRIESLAKILTSEMGKPISQAQNELKASKQRIQFFLDNVNKVLKEEEVFNQGGMVEKISYEPLGVIANISAWNYPYFVGLNVIIPALLTGNSVLYKPSEYATLSGLDC